LSDVPSGFSLSPRHEKIKKHLGSFVVRALATALEYDSFPPISSINLSIAINVVPEDQSCP
jgi:hypothetical protein